MNNPTTIYDAVARGWSMHIQCECGHTVEWKSLDLFSRFRNSLGATLEGVKLRLRCEACGKPRPKAHEVTGEYVPIKGHNGEQVMKERMDRLLASWPAKR